MLKNKIIVKKIRNIAILIMAMIIMIGAYKNIDISRAEDVVELQAMALDNYGYLADERFALEAKKIEEDLYEIELPDSINSKKINQIVKVTLDDYVPEEVLSEGGVKENALTENAAIETPTEDQSTIPEEDVITETPSEDESTVQENTPTEDSATEGDGEQGTEEVSVETPSENENHENTENGDSENGNITDENVIEEINVEMVENKIYLTEEQIDEKQINIEVVYDIAILEGKEEGGFNKTLLLEKSEEERKLLEGTGIIGPVAENTETTNIPDNIKVLYSKILRYEDEENKKLVELKGYLPKEAQIQVQKVEQQQLTEIFGEEQSKIDVAYDIKIVVQVVKQVPVDETNPESEKQEIVEIIEINPEEYGETCEVIIKDKEIEQNSQVYHVNEDNIVEQVKVKENDDGNISFEAESFSIYAITSGKVEIIETENVKASSIAFTYWYYEGGVEKKFTHTPGTDAEVEMPESGEVYLTVSGGGTSSIRIYCERSDGTSYTDYIDSGDTITITNPWSYQFIPYSNGEHYEDFAVWFKVKIPNNPPSITFAAIRDDLLREYDADNNNGSGHTNSTSTWKDLTGNFDATINGGATFSTEVSNPDEFLTLDGSNDWVNIGTVSLYNKVTLEATITPNQIQSGEIPIIENIDDGGLGLVLQNGVPEFIVHVPEIGYVRATASSALTVGQRYHIAGTYDGVTLRLYIDGSEVVSREQAGIIAPPVNDPVMAVGAHTTGTTVDGHYAKMKIHTIRVYNRALEAVEIAQNKKASVDYKTWTKAHTLTAWLRDGEDGLALGAGIEGTLSFSNSTLDLMWFTADEINYEQGATNASTQATLKDSTAEAMMLAGKYFLAVRPIGQTVKDLEGNVQTNTEISKTRVYFDNAKPKWNAKDMNINTENNAFTVKIVGSDEHSGVNITETTNRIQQLQANGTEFVEVYVGGELSAVQKTLSGPVTENGKIIYTLTVSGGVDLSKKISLKVPEGVLIDYAGNTNIETELKLYSTLRVAGNWNSSTSTYDYESATGSAFLGNTSLQRNTIEKITFVSGIDGANSTAWDVSAEQDGSIMAWYESTYTQDYGTAYNVTIGGIRPIFANKDSNYLFAWIGAGGMCDEENVLINLNLLNTSEVETMIGMFLATGHTSMTSLNLGDNFDTSNVTDMSHMFEFCGYSWMTSLNLGSKFDTSNVTNMTEMFEYCGWYDLTSLYLGNQFFTKNVQNMNRMFYECGINSMTSLDLGPAFTKIANSHGDMFTSAGKDGACTIYVPESIYHNQNNFQLHSTSASYIEHTRGTLNLKYKPKWEKVKTVVNIDKQNLNNSTMTITVKGYADSNVYSSGVNSSLTKDHIQVYIDGDLANGINVSVENKTAFYPNATLYGDVNLDGTVNTKDSTKVLKYASGSESLTDVQKANADVNLDGEINYRDSVLILRYFTDLIPGLPVSNEVRYEITLSNFDQGQIHSSLFKHESGNVRLDFANGSLKDQFWNQQCMVNGGVKVPGQIADETKNSITATDGTAIPNITNTTPVYMFADFIAPEIVKVKSSVDTSAKTQTIIVKVQDKYLNISDALTTNDINVYVDGELATSVTKNIKTLTKIPGKIYGDANGDGVVTDADRSLIQEYEVGLKTQGDLAGFGNADVDLDGRVDMRDAMVIAQYLNNQITTLPVEDEKGLYEITLSNFEQTKSAEFNTYTNWSGTVEIEIAAGCVSDTSQNKNKKTTIKGNFVDFVKPDVTYKYFGTSRDNPAPSSPGPDIDYTNKTFKMIFEITDKYFNSSTITASNFKDHMTIKIGNDDITKSSDVTITMTSVEDVHPLTSIKKTVNGSVTTLASANAVIGKRYTLLFEGLDEAIIKEGDTYADYSGVVTVAIPKDKATDTTGNKNGAKTITSGMPNEVVVDVVDPIWSYRFLQRTIEMVQEQIKLSGNIQLTGTDKYFDAANSSLVQSQLEIYKKNQDGSLGEATTTELSVTSLSAATNDGNVPAEIGEIYTLAFTGQAELNSEFIIRIPAGTLIDLSGNTNQEPTDIPIVFTGYLAEKLGSLTGEDYSKVEYTNEDVYVYAYDNPEETVTYSVNGGTAKGEGTANKTILSTTGEHTVVVTIVDRYGTTSTMTYKILIDKNLPTITTSATSKQMEWRNTALNVTITAADTGGAGLLSSNEYKYCLLTDGTTPTASTTWSNYTSGTAVTLNPGTTGAYNLYIKPISDNATYKDGDGNISTTEDYHSYGKFYFDYTKPEIEEPIDNTSGGDWTNKDVTITVKAKDPSPGSGIYQIQYSSDNKSTWKSTLTSGDWNTDSNIDSAGTVGNTGTVKHKFTSEMNATVYVRAEDKAGRSENVAGNYSNISETPVKIDKTTPEVGSITYKKADGTTYTSYGSTFNWTNQDITLTKINGKDKGTVQSGHKSTTYTITGPGYNGTTKYTDATKKLSAEGVYKMGIETKDNAGNSSATAAHAYIDKTRPVWNYTAKDIYYTSANDVGTNDYANKDRIVKITVKGTDAYIGEGNNVVTSTLKSKVNDIKVLVNGTDITSSVTKTLSDPSNNGTTEVTHTLTITGITGDGILSVVLPNGTLSDAAGNKNVQKTLTTDATASDSESLDPDLDVEIDNTIPAVGISSTVLAADQYNVGQTITIMVKYKDKIFTDKYVKNHIGNGEKTEAPGISLKFGGTAAKGSATCTDVVYNYNEDVSPVPDNDKENNPAVEAKTVIKYTYKIQSGDSGALTVSTNAVYDIAGNQIKKTDVTPSQSVKVEVTSPATGYYAAGQVVTLKVTYEGKIYNKVDNSYNLIDSATEVPKMTLLFRGPEPDSSATSVDQKGTVSCTSITTTSPANKTVITYTYTITSGDHNLLLVKQLAAVYDEDKFDVDLVNALPQGYQITADTVAPDVPTITNSSNQQWTNQNVTITATSKDHAMSKGLKEIQKKLSTDSDWDTTWSADADAATSEARSESAVQTGSVQGVWSTQGDYVLNVRAVDKLGNTSSSTSTKIRIDKTAPEWSLKSKDIYKSSANDVGTTDGKGIATTTDQYANSGRTVKLVIKGTDAYIGDGNNVVTSTLKSKVNNIKVLVNGTDITSSVTKTLSDPSNNGTTEVTHTLTITGIPNNGELKVQIPSGTLSDAAGNTSAAKEINPSIIIDNTAPTVALKVTAPTDNITYYKQNTEITITATYSDTNIAAKIYKEATSNNVIDTTGEAPVMAITFGGAAAKGTISATSISDNVITYKYTIQFGDDGRLKVSSLGTVYDAAGNARSVTSETTPSGYTIIADTTDPKWVYVSKDIYYSSANDVGTDNFANSSRTVKLVIKGTDGSGVTSSLAKSHIQVKVNGSDVTIADSNKTIGEAQYNADRTEVTVPITIKGITGNGILTIVIPSGSLHDTPGNTNVAKTFTTDTSVNEETDSKYPDLDVTIDNISPGVTLHVTRPNVTNPVAGYYKAGQEVTITATYDQTVYTDKYVTNPITEPSEAPAMTLAFGGTAAKGNSGKATCTEVSGNVITYKYTITNGDNGELTIASLGAAYDIAGNAKTATNQKPGDSVYADTINPVLLSITADKESPTNASSITYTFTFSEDVYGFTADDITIGSQYGSKGAFNAVSKTVYTLVVNTTDDVEYTETVSVANDVCTDRAANGNTEATSTGIVVDRIEPTLVIAADKTSPTNASSITYTFTFSEPVTGFTIDDITIGSEYGSKGQFKAVSTTVYTLVVNTTDDVEYTETVSVAGGVCIDKVTNINIGATSEPIVVDRIEPVLTSITANRTSPTNASSITYTFIFSENVTGFTADDITIGSTYGSKGTFTAVSGTEYTLVVNTTDNVAYQEYVTVANGVCVDKAGNGNIGNTSSQTHVDRVEPVWNIENISISNPQVTLDIVGTDSGTLASGYASNTLDAGDITITVDGETASSITKTLTKVSETADGVRYTLTLTGWQQSSKQDGKTWLEWSGSTSISIAAGTLTDKAGNTSNGKSATIGHVDFIKPRIERVSASSNTVTFDVLDKYLDTTDEITAAEITNVYIDNVQMDSTITKTLTKTAITGTVNGSSKTVGWKYVLTLGNVSQARTAITEGNNIGAADADVAYGQYTEYSGTVHIDIAADAVKDTSNNKNNAVSKMAGAFMDTIAPNVTYKYMGISRADNSSNTVNTTNPDVDYENNTFKMIFDITDKYFNASTGTLTTSMTQAQILQYLTIKVGGIDISTIDTKVSDPDFEVSIESVEDVYLYGTAKKTVNGSIQSVSATSTDATLKAAAKIGKRYTLKITNFEQTFRNEIGYADYSGVVTVALKSDLAKDSSGRGNGAKTITSGVNLAEGNNAGGSQKVIDFVNPIITRTASSVDEANRTVTMGLIATDKYFNTGDTISNSELTIWINGVKQTGVTITVTEATGKLTDENGNIYGEAYTVVVTGLPADIAGLKVRVKEGAILDQYRNPNLEVELGLDSFLRKTDTETASNSPFLNNKRGVTRDKIEKVIFETSTAGMDHSTKWDVSEQQDESILAWTTAHGSTGRYIVHIASDIGTINANPNSSYLFSYVGTNSTSSTVIENLDFLQIGSVTDMSYMFSNFAYGNTSFTEFYLGAGFDTTKVTNMAGMFQNCGYTAMKSLDLGEQFLVANVENMTNMFNGCGKTAMTSLDLGQSFSQIPNGFSSGFITNTGKSGACTIYAPEKVYSSKTALRTSTGAGITYSNGTINPIYSPKWEYVSSSVSGNVMTIIVKGYATRNFNIGNSLTDPQEFYNSTITHSLTAASQVTVYVDGESAGSTMVTSVAEKTANRKNGTVQVIDTNGNFQEVTGVTEVQYEVKLDVTKFVQASLQSGKDYMEWSGNISLSFAAGTLRDYYGNRNVPAERAQDSTPVDKETTGEPFVDDVKPIIVQVPGETTTDTTNKTTTVVFNVFDKYIDTDTVASRVSTDEITVYVDGEVASNVTKSITGRSNITKTINGKTQVIGQKYTLRLSNFGKTVNANGYQDWSGTVSIDIAAGAVADKSGNVSDAVTGFVGDYVDFIGPAIKYQHASSNMSGDTYTMTFTVTDKYYTATGTTPFTTADITNGNIVIKMQNGQRDASGNLIVYNLKDVAAAQAASEYGVKYELTSEEVKVASMKKTTNVANKTVGTATNQVIGHKYQLIIRNLDRASITTGQTTSNYSGVVMVSIPKDRIVDTKGNKNTAASLTSGIHYNAGSTSGNQTEIDVVNPIVQNVSSSVNPLSGTATVKVRITDTYYKPSETLVANEIKIIVNGTEVTTGLTKTISDPTPLKETRYKNDGLKADGTAETETEEVQYGVEYTITVSGYGTGAHQVKFQVISNAIKDITGNGNSETTFILYNTLKTTNAETEQTSTFLGITGIQRQHIEKVTFLEKFPTEANKGTYNGTFENGKPKVDNTKCWDVSAQQDKTIVAWYTGSNPYQVYIASDHTIVANRDSSYLFSYIGYAASCTVTTMPIVNLNLLNTSSVRYMSRMFYAFGYDAMTTFDLGNNFYTSNVIAMNGMFQNCGYTAMTSFSFGEHFVTSNVSTMSSMFNSWGYTLMTSLDVSTLNTSAVTDMSHMFSNCGHENMQTLTLGSNFDTTNVTNMSSMFAGCGYKKLKSLNLGSKFNTAKVTSMDVMFQQCGHDNMETLILGDKFDTTNVTNMGWMFKETGYEKLKSIDLGTKFDTSKVTNFRAMFIDFGRKKLESLDLGDKFYINANVGEMGNMFAGCGAENMTTLDLGPAFTKISSLNSGFMLGAGKNGACTIYVGEAIYQDKNNFKLDTNSTTTINWARGTINPIYSPKWILEDHSVDFANKTATIDIMGTLDPSVYTSDFTCSLTTDLIKLVDGLGNTLSGTKTLSTPVTTTNATTGAKEIRYTITVTNYPIVNAQLKIQMARGSLVDDYGHRNIELEFSVYSSLKAENTSTTPTATSKFLGNTTVERQNIEKIEFVSNTDAAPRTNGEYAIDGNKCWDVSLYGDKSIIAWRTDTAPYTVYIGSEGAIFANTNSTWLFGYIGYGENCDEQNVITNLNLLHTHRVTSMNSMFRATGYRAMKTLNLGNNFDTTNVTSMHSMFRDTGYMAMENFSFGSNFKTESVTNMAMMFYSFGYKKIKTLDLSGFNTSSLKSVESMFSSCGRESMHTLTLGSNFDTSKVTGSMSGMFSQCGRNLLKSLDLGDKFYTSGVTSMSSMFEGCGYGALETIDLGDNFDMSNVTNTGWMFKELGYTKMESFDLGDKFNTSKVTNPRAMFNNTGYKKLKSLDLGDKFYMDVTKVTDMGNMFAGCGRESMTVLDLGPHFKIINENEDILSSCGKSSGCVIYAPEEIYGDETHYKTPDGTFKATITANVVINPIYRPKWEKVSATVNTTNGTVEITAKAVANESITIDDYVTINYSSNITVASNIKTILGNAKVFIDNVDVTSTTKPTISIDTSGVTTSATQVTGYKVTLSNFEEAVRQTGVPYKEWTGNIVIQIDGRGQAASTYGKNVLVDAYGNESMAEIQIKGTWMPTGIDERINENGFKYEPVTANTAGKMFIDTIKPEITYQYSSTDINKGDKTLTVVYEVIDKYFAHCLLGAEDITVKMIDTGETANITKTRTSKTLDTEVITASGKRYKTDGYIEYDIDGDGKREVIGHRYQLVISGLDKGGGVNYSGPISLTFKAGEITDSSGNANAETTITIGINEDDGNPGTTPNAGLGYDQGNQQIVDVVDPVWQNETPTITTNSVSITLKAIDKYLKTSSLTKNDIKVMQGATDVTSKFTINLGSATSITNGKSYPLTLTGFEETDAQYATARTNGRLYREFSGPISIVIPAEKLEDNYGNKDKNGLTIDINPLDTIKPDITVISATEPADTQTIVFDVTDKYLQSTGISTSDTSKIKVYVDNVEATNITKTITKTEELKATVDGAQKVIGYRYTLQLSNIIKATRTATGYKDWSGTLSVKIPADTAKDTKGNGNAEKELYKGFMDNIAPDLMYVHSSSNINATNNSYTMTFSITDKYYDASASTPLSLNDIKNGKIKILMQNGQVNASNQAIVYDLYQQAVAEAAKATAGELANPITIGFTATEIKKNMNITENGTVKAVTNKVIGHTYTLTITNLEKSDLFEGLNTLGYSGTLTVSIPKDRIVDTSGKKNVAKTITTGIDIPDETNDPIPVDVIEPIWKKKSLSYNDVTEIATIVIRGTDTYFDVNSYNSDPLTKSKIKLIENGTDITSTTDIEITLSSVTPLKENRLVGGSIQEVQYGVEYTITLTNISIEDQYVKVHIPAETLKDTNGNKSKVTEFVLFTTLLSTATEVGTEENPGSGQFLGNDNIERQNIEKIVFHKLNSMDEAPAINNTTCWDVSNDQDQSILAWYEQSSAPYTVNIGSDSIIFANTDSTRLFSYIGYSDICNETEIIDNIELLNVGNVQNMNYMFYYFGYHSMETLDLGTNFNTSNVVYMTSMFHACGHQNMTTLNLGSNFDTTNVEDFSYMFYNTGRENLENFKFGNQNINDPTYWKLGNKFDTTNAKNMHSMFECFGYNDTKTLDLGDNFNTINVTNMAYMFYGTGFSKMENLILGDKFDTTNVQNMNSMFCATGRYSMLKLDLGDKFYTTNATDMRNMFAYCRRS